MWLDRHNKYFNKLNESGNDGKVEGYGAESQYNKWYDKKLKLAINDEKWHLSLYVDRTKAIQVLIEKKKTPFKYR